MRIDLGLACEQRGRGRGIGARHHQRVELVVMFGAPFLRRGQLEHQRRSGDLQLGDCDPVRGGEVADRVNGRIACHQHIGELGECAQRPDFLRGPGGGVGSEEKRGEVRRNEIAAAGAERLDGAGLAGCAPNHRDGAETHRFGGALDQMLVLHHQERQRHQIERPQQPQLGGLGERRPRAGKKPEHQCGCKQSTTSHSRRMPGPISQPSRAPMSGSRLSPGMRLKSNLHYRGPAHASFS